MTAQAPIITLTTARQPGAVALIQVHGAGTDALLRAVTGRDVWRAGRLHLVRFADMDEGLAVLWHARWAQLMPHGGPRVVQKLIDHLIAQGAVYEAQPAARDVYPEARSDIEADMLDAIARAASPAAIDLLSAQPDLWRAWWQRMSARDAKHPHPGPLPRPEAGEGDAILARSRLWDRLIEPASVVVIGRANVGKSTLTNAMLGRSVSVVADLPGTTRDWVASLAELGATLTHRAATHDAAGDHAAGDALSETAVAVRWHDTPGLRGEAQAGRIEQRALELAQQVVRAADVLIAMTDADTPWPDAADLPRAPDLWVLNKVDDAPATSAHDAAAGAHHTQPLAISATRDRNLDALAHRVLGALQLDALRDDVLWAFSDTLRTALREGDVAALRKYVNVARGE